MNRKVLLILISSILTLCYTTQLEIYHWLILIDVSGLTAQLNPDKVLNAHVFHKDPGGGSSLEVEGDIKGKLHLESWELQI